MTASGQPRGLYTLFFTEMWERFSYYGMRGLLVLFLIDKARGGFAMSYETATAIYGMYTASAFLAALPGGWVADRILGARRAVWCGGIIIACGHFTLALESARTFYLGLILIVIGTGLLKPNVSTMIGELYPEGGARRDAGFTIFYMGINLGAALGPIVCSALGEKVKWRYGFAAAGVGMILGLAQLYLFRRSLGEIGRARPQSDRRARAALVTCVVAIGIVAALCLIGIIPVDAVRLAWIANHGLLAMAVVYFVCIFLLGRLNKDEKRGMWQIILLFIGAVLFWTGFEQMGSSFNLFAKDFTNRHLFGFELPASAFQSVGPIFVIAFSPVAAAAWIWLAKRKMNPGVPVKFGVAMLFLAFGFLLIGVAAGIAGRVGSVGPWWLIGTYFLHTIGELCLSPVGLSSITKLSPHRLVGQMMGVWFLGASIGNLIAGLMAGSLKIENAAQLSSGFFQMALLPMIAGIVFIVLAKPIRHFLGEVR